MSHESQENCFTPAPEPRPRVHLDLSTGFVAAGQGGHQLSNKSIGSSDSHTCHPYFGVPLCVCIMKIWNSFQKLSAVCVLGQIV